MYLRISRGRFDPARYDDLQRFAEAVVAAIQRRPGFQRYQGGVDRTAGTLVAVSTWDTEDHARFARDTLGDVVARMQAGGVQLEPPEVYEVTNQA